MTEPAAPVVDARVRAAIDTARKAQDAYRRLYAAAAALAASAVTGVVRVRWPGLHPLALVAGLVLLLFLAAVRWVILERRAEVAAEACDVVEVETPHGVVLIDPDGIGP